MVNSQASSPHQVDLQVPLYKAFWFMVANRVKVQAVPRVVFSQETNISQCSHYHSIHQVHCANASEDSHAWLSDLNI